RSRPADPSADDRQDCQNHERDEHNSRTLMDSAMSVSAGSMDVVGMRGHRGGFVPMWLLDLTAVIAEKRHEPEAKHIKRRQKGSEYTDQPVHPAGLVGAP